MSARDYMRPIARTPWRAATVAVLARGFLFRLLAFVACLAPAVAWAQPSQQDHRKGFVPANDERFAVVQEFYAFDASLPLDARKVDEWDVEDGRHEKIVFTTQSGERVPGDLVLPATGEGPFACVLLLHGLGNDRDRRWQDDRRALPDDLLSAGIAVFAIDLRFHGERSAANDYESPVYLTLDNTLFVRARDMAIQSTIDARRALAYLRSRRDIDRSRLAVAGCSMGAMIALRLDALEDGLAAVLVAAVPITEQPLPTDPFNFAARCRTPTLLQIGRDDWLSSPSDAELLYGLLPAGARELVFYEAGHRLPPAFAKDAAAWLTDRLKNENAQSESGRSR